MNRLPDGTLEHLRRVSEWPDLSGTRYQLEELIGQGGMGWVFRAVDRELSREVALKVLRTGAGDHDSMSRLRREARVLARLEHPGIVSVHDVGSLPDGRVYYVMKLVRGVRLDQQAEDTPLPERLRLFLRICETVAFAHAHGVIHRDLKPGNIMVGPFGEVLVMDWGIAKVREEQDPAPPRRDSATQADSGREESWMGQTIEGTVLGTPGYMAPEQARGQIGLIDERTDVYALGAILRYLVTGFDPTRPAAGSPRKAPPPLAAVVQKSQASDPSVRYAGALDVAEEVARFLDARPVLAYREGLLERVRRLAAKYQAAILLILAYLAMRLLFLVTREL